MSGKVGQEPVRRASLSNTKEVAERKGPSAAAESTAAAPPALSERSQKKAGKVSSFTKTSAAFTPSSGKAVETSAPLLRAGSAAALAQLQSGGRVSNDPKQIRAAEEAAAFNSPREAPWTMAAMKKDPKKFLRDVVQLDGDQRSTVDQTACGSTALLMGMINARPESIQQLATKLVEKDGTLTANGKVFTAALPKAALVDLTLSLGRLREGKEFTPLDVTMVAVQMQQIAQQGGTDSKDLRALAASVESLGIQLPPMELQLFGKPDGSMGHWRVESKGTQFNPWPDENGRSGQLPAKAGLRDGLLDGEGWVRREQVRLGTK